MKKHIFLAAAAASMLAISCQQTPKTVDWTKMVSGTTPEGDTLEFKYDQNGNLIFYGNFTNKYNEKNQLIESLCEDRCIKYEYDDKGNLISETDDSTTYTYNYNDKNLMVSKSFADGPLSGNTTYEYDGNKVTETFISKFNTEDEIITDTSIKIKYCIDQEFKYDTLEIADENKVSFPHKHMTKSAWQKVCGQYQNVHSTSYIMHDGDYKLFSSISTEYNESGYVQKQTRIDYEKGDTTITTYTAEGNKLTGSDGGVFYYLEK